MGERRARCHPWAKWCVDEEYLEPCSRRTICGPECTRTQSEKRPPHGRPVLPNGQIFSQSFFIERWKCSTWERHRQTALFTPVMGLKVHSITKRHLFRVNRVHLLDLTSWWERSRDGENHLTVSTIGIILISKPKLFCSISKEPIKNPFMIFISLEK